MAEKSLFIKGLEDRISSAAFFILAFLVIVESRTLSLGDIHNPGPGFVPFFLGLSMAFLSGLNFCVPDVKMTKGTFWNNWQAAKNILLIFSGLIIYLILLKPLGFLIDTFCLIIFLSKLSGAESYQKGIWISLVSLGVVYLLFYRFLIIPFPRGFLGF